MPAGGAKVTTQEWNDYLRRSRTWRIRIGHDLLHSEAYRALKYAPALKVLNWFFEKVHVKVNKKRRGKERYEVVNDGEMSFSYQEAGFRGLTSNQFSRALKELHSAGFIDLKKHGSGLMGDYTIYLLSQRWRSFGTPQFEEKEFPKSSPFGFRGKYFQRSKSNAGQRSKSNVGNDF